MTLPARSRQKAAPAKMIFAVLVATMLCGALIGACAPVPRGDDEGDTLQPERETAQPDSGLPPQVLHLAASTERIMPLMETTIVCDAIHPEGEDLTYTWSVSDGELHGQGDQVRWVAPEAAGLYRVFVTVSDSRGNETSTSLGLSVRANRPPRIQSVRPEAGDDIEWFAPGARVAVQCEAQDEDGDRLTYQWSASEGDLWGEGASVIWVAPDTLGIHWIAVTVEDPFGGTDEVSIPITVSAAEPPLIYGFKLTADHGQFMRYGTSWRIYKETSCSIEALVDDDDGRYLYIWSADAGTVTADGPNAIWQAPSRGGWVTVLFQIRDPHGNESSSSVRILVETCAVCG